MATITIGGNTFTMQNYVVQDHEDFEAKWRMTLLDYLRVIMGYRDDPDWQDANGDPDPDLWIGRGANIPQMMEFMWHSYRKDTLSPDDVAKREFVEELEIAMATMTPSDVTTQCIALLPWFETSLGNAAGEAADQVLFP